MSSIKSQDNKHLEPDQVFDEINTLRQEVKSLQKSVAILRRDILWRFRS